MSTADDHALPPPLASYIDGHSDELLSITSEIIGIDTQNPPGDTRTAADRVETELSDAGLSVERVAVDPQKPNVLGTVPGQRDTTLCFNGHLDTVPFDASEWTHDPLGERSGDRLYGRGATDMKGALAAMIQIANAFAETGTTPPVTLLFAFVSDEETGGDAGLETLLDLSSFAPDACVIGETTSRNSRTSVTVADRGSIWLTLEATGTAAHGSRPMLGENAIDRLYDAITQLRTKFGTRQLQLPESMDPIIEETVGFYAPEAGPDATRSLFEHPSINLGVLEGGDAVNTVPASARARVDIRLTAGVDTQTVLQSIRDCVVDCPGVEITNVSWSEGTYEPLDSPLVSAATAAAETVVEDTVYRRSATGGGDAKTLRHAGIPTVELGFGTQTAHGVDEYTTVDALERNARTYATVPYTYAAQFG
jgi:succinyl-diaminopimelate desuccinylase